MPESVFRDTFITYLELELQAEVRNCHLITLEDCMREAQLVDDRNVALKLAQQIKLITQTLIERGTEGF